MLFIKGDSLASSVFTDKENEEIQLLRQQLQMLKSLVKSSQAQVQQVQSVGAEQQAELRVQLKRLQEVVDQERSAKKQALEEISALRLQFDSLKKRCLEAEASAKENQQDKLTWQSEREQFQEQKASLEEALSYKDKEISRLQPVVDELSGECEALKEQVKKQQDDLDKLVKNQEDAEGRLKIAHYHLAKKVKESSDLTDKIQSQDEQLHSLNIDLNESNQQLISLKSMLEKASEREQELNSRMQELTKNIESQTVAWEEKYQEMYVKFQDNERHMKEFVKMKEKYQQLQLLWERFGQVMQQDFKEERPSFPVQETLSLSNKEKQKEPAVDRPYQNLFGMPRHQQNYGNAFFD